MTTLRCDADGPYLQGVKTFSDSRGYLEDASYVLVFGPPIRRRWKSWQACEAFFFFPHATAASDTVRARRGSTEIPNRNGTTTGAQMATRWHRLSGDRAPSGGWASADRVSGLHRATRRRPELSQGHASFHPTHPAIRRSTETVASLSLPGVLCVR